MLLFLVLVLGIITLLIINPRVTLVLILGGLMLFYDDFILGTLFNIGEAKVYPYDFIVAALALFLAAKTLFVKSTPAFAQNSSKFFAFYFVWGLIAIVRGIPSYSSSTIGEARMYTLPIIFYFFITNVLKDKTQALSIVKGLIGFLPAMIAVHFVTFVGDEASFDGRDIYRFLNAAEALLIAFVLVSLYVFHISGAIKNGSWWFYIVFISLGGIVVIVQHRSVWLATIGGIIVAHLVLLRKLDARNMVRTVIIIISLSVLGLFAWKSIGDDTTATLQTSASFIQDAESDPTGSWRMLGWEQEMQKVWDNLLFGQGLGGYSDWFDGQEEIRVHVHNDYIMIPSKLGLVGLFILFIGVSAWYVEMRRFVRMEHDTHLRLLGYAIEVCIIMHLIFAFFYYFTIFFWVLLAVGTVLSRRYQHICKYATVAQ